MKIECLIRRPGGSFINLGGTLNNKSRTVGGTNYHFTPGVDKDGKELEGPHICDVRDRFHISKLLAIPEGYAVYDPDLVDTDEPETKADAKPTQTTSTAPATTVTAPAAPAAHQGLTEGPHPDVSPTPYDSLNDAQLSAKFEERIGKKPHPNAKRETIIRTLVAEDRKAAAEAKTEAKPTA